MLHVDLITVCFLHDSKKPQMAVSPDEEEVEEEKMLQNKYKLGLKSPVWFASG